MATLWRRRRFQTLLGSLVLLSLLVSAISSPTSAAPEALKWLPVNIPAEGQAGNWVLAAGSDVLYPTLAIDGAIYAHGRGLTYTLYKSTNGGYSWSYIGNVRDTIVGIATSPHDANVVYYATNSRVYRSTDAGKTFAQMPASPGGAGSGNIEITSIAVAWLNHHIIAVGTRDVDAAQFGGIYTLEEDQFLAGWADSSAGAYDVYAVAFSPNYTGDRQLVAVVTDEIDTYVTGRAGNSVWGAGIGNARLERDNAVPHTAVSVNVSAAIAFPEDYDGSAVSGNNVLYIGIDTGAGNGDVYRVNASGGSSANDLNVGATYGLRNVDITGLVVRGSDASARLLAGAASAAQTYYSSDAGKNWSKSSKEPTGSSKTFVLMAPGQASRTYAATSGSESALSISLDHGDTWNQISLVDTSIGNILDLSPSPVYSRDGTLFLLTFGGKHSLWRSTNNATSWERVFSSALANVNSLSLVELSPQYGSGSQVVFLKGVSGGRTAVWQSVDNGRKFNARPATDPVGGSTLAIDAWAIVSDTTLFISSWDGSATSVYLSNNSGFYYSNGAAAGSQPFNAIALSPSYTKDGTVLAGNRDGWIYYSSDNGTSFQPLPPTATTAPLTDLVTVAFDSQFEKNHTVYAASSTANKGIYRFIIGKSATWESIDGTLPSGGMLSQLIASTDGMLYAANSKAGGGMERCLDPNYALGPTFDTVTRGLPANAILSGLRQNGHTLWAIDSANVKLMTFIDTLTGAPVPVTPADAATGVGNLVNHTIKDVRLDWEASEDATSYQWQFSYTRDFSSLPSGYEGTSEASSARLPTLDPGTSYYWRVRASAPVLSPWSTKRSFTTGLDTEVAPLKLDNPVAGASDVPVRPLFRWNAVGGANAYELIVDTDATFASPVVSRTGATAVPATSWQCEVSLKETTTYYWKVRAIGGSTASAWSAVNSFTTQPAVRSQASATPPPLPLSPLLPYSSVAPGVTPAAAPSQTPAPGTTSLPNTPAQSATPPPSVPTQAPSIPLMPLMNWVAYLIGALLIAILLLLVILLVVVIRLRR